MSSGVKTPWSPGTVVDRRYKVQELINVGGESFVHRALDKQANVVVVLRQYQRDDAESRQRWERERSIRIQSDHVAEHRGGGEFGGSLYVVVEHVDGRNLAEILEEQGTFLPEAEALEFTRQIARGLADMHDVGWVHRDLKPGNVVVDGGGQAKIIDLGLVRAWHGQTIACDGLARGTLPYMSPEHLIDPGAVDHRSDLYGLGVVTYEMTTGTLPFDGASEEDVKQKILYEPPLAPRVLAPDLSGQAEDVVLRLLAKPPAARFPSARSLLLHLEGDGSGAFCPMCGTQLAAEGSFCCLCGVNVREVGSATAFLCVHTPRGPRWLTVPPAGCELGRGTLDSPNRAVSSRHARLVKSNGSWYVEDLGSTNGTRVDGQRVQGRAVLTTPCCLQFADVQCLFVERVP